MTEIIYNKELTREEKKQKLVQLLNAIDNMDGMVLTYDTTKHQLTPLRNKIIYMLYELRRESK